MKKFFLFVFLIVLIAGGLIGWKIFGPSVSAQEGEYFYIRTGENKEAVRENLVANHHIKNASWFDRLSRILKYNTVKPGRYKLKKGMSLYQLVRMLRAGNQTPVNFVITKLRTKESLAGRAGGAFEFDSTQMIQLLNNNDSLKKYGLDSNTVMAAAMPLTYSLNWNTTPQKLFQQFYNAYQKFWTAERKQKADSLGLSPAEVVVLASIIEEETNKKADKYNIASTYLNRVREGMPLQADPTVKFALRDFGLKRITGAHLSTVSPYNTYMNKGIPPGPICTPSVESIEAVLDAPRTDYLYFVASHKFDGSSVFTSNYEEHSKYARLYQQELTRRMDSSKKARAQ
jgi:UPF0755 protein